MKRCKDCHYQRPTSSNTSQKSCHYLLETNTQRGGLPENCTKFKPRNRAKPVYTPQDDVYEAMCEAPLLSVGRYGRNRMGITEEY